MREPLRSIALVGFMGAGKTTVARRVAEIARIDFADLDELIAARQGRRAGQIIADEGEDGFRRVETDALRTTLGARPNHNFILALGGGAWTIEANRELIRARGWLAVWLDAPFASCWRRISRGLASQHASARPLAPDQTAAEQRYLARLPLYATADIHIDAERAPDDIAASIIDAARQTTEEVL